MVQIPSRDNEMNMKLIQQKIVEMSTFCDSVLDFARTSSMNGM